MRAIWPLLFAVGLFIPAEPAWSQIETVVVTAEKRSEDVQSVPIAVTAFSGQELKSRQVVQYKDLQFHVPNVTYTNTNFGGASFQIRGIGIGAIGYDAEAGTAMHINDVYLANPPVTEATFYDIDRIEVLRGPQSTLYGRGATGGTVNIITAKPQLQDLSGSAEVAYGNYQQSEIKAMLNVPLVTDQLGFRIAGDWLRHNGFVRNIADGHRVDSNDTYSARATIRWQPSESTTVDLTGAYSHEGDSHMRAVKQLCTRDPTGILGCLPDSAFTDAVNLNGVFTNTVSSVQAFSNLLTPVVGPVDAQNLGLYDLTQVAAAPPPSANPSSYRQINSDFDPRYKTSETYVAINAHQTISPWLNATLVAAYEDHFYFSQESYNNVAQSHLDQARLGTFDATDPTTSLGDLYHLLSGGNPTLDLLGLASGGFVYTPSYAALYAPYFSHAGELPASALKGLGITGGHISSFSPNQTAYDQSDDHHKQYSAELRFNSNFKGPFNFLLAAYYLRTTGLGDYYVAGNTVEYPGPVLGSILGPLTVSIVNPTAPAACKQVGCNYAPTYYHNWGRNLELESRSVFGEAYYQVIPEELKLTVGARFTDDRKNDLNRIAFLSGLIPLGTTDEGAADAAMAQQGQVDFDPGNGTPPFDVWEHSKKTFDKWTGRAVLDWTPATDFTDKTLVYASYARGYKSGGFNPGVEPNLAGVSSFYKPEGIDALELGTKNELLDNTLQTNLTAWYYNYQGFQVSSIVQNTSVNSNIGAHLWGTEAEFVWQPGDAWNFDLNLGYEHSSVANVFLVDTRNLTAGRSDVVLIKDATATASSAQNCVVYRLPSAAFNTPADASVPGFFAPPAAGGGETGLAAHGIPWANYGLCGAATRPSESTMNTFGFSYTDPRIGSGDQSGGVAINLHGNRMLNSPPFTVSFGAQYTAQLGGGYTLVPRADFYWQDASWMRVFEDGADRLHPYVQINALMTIFAPESQWYVQAYGKNLGGTNAKTGGYLSDAPSGLFTNAFLVDPRTFGARIGAQF